jgi:hypothetical protein
MAACRNVFLIRRPAEVIASNTAKRETVDLADIGVARQAELFDREAQRLSRAPLVIDSADVAADPRSLLTALCAALGIPFTDAMLSWPAGSRPSDGVWAPAWYDQVERSTGFEIRTRAAAPALPPASQRVADAAQPYYAALAKWALSAS